MIAVLKRDYVLNYVKRLQRAEPHGTQYFYNTGDTLLPSYILRRATGTNASDCCSERFWAPIGCEQDGFFALESDDGNEVVGCCCGATCATDAILDADSPNGVLAVQLSPPLHVKHASLPDSITTDQQGQPAPGRLHPRPKGGASSTGRGGEFSTGARTRNGSGQPAAGFF